MFLFRIKTLAVAVALICAGPALAIAQSEESAGVVTTVNGDATLFPAVAAAQPVSLRLRDEIFVRDRIQTQERSLVRVLLGGKALITVRELSVLTVTEDAGRVTVGLQSGKIGVAVVKARMRPGEIIEIRTPNATAAVRGTVFVVDVYPVKPGQAPGGQTTTTRVHLFHGALDVSARLDPSNPTVRLAELQSVVVSGTTLGAVTPISRDAVAAITADLKPRQMRQPDAPSEFTGGLVAREQGRAVMLAASLLAPVQGAPLPLKNVKGPVQTVQNVVGGVTGSTEQILENLMDRLGFEGLGGAVTGLTSTVGDTAGGLTNTLGGTVAGIGGTVGGLTGSVGGTVGGLGGTLGGALGWGGVGGTLGGTVGGVGGTLGGAVGGVGGTLGGTTLGGTVGGVGGPLGGAVGGVGGAMGGLTGSLGGTVGGTVGGLGGGAGTVGGLVGGLLGGLGQGGAGR